MRTMIGLWKNWKNVPMDVKLIYAALIFGGILTLCAFGVAAGLRALLIPWPITIVASGVVMFYLMNGFLKEVITNWMSKEV